MDNHNQWGIAMEGLENVILNVINQFLKVIIGEYNNGSLPTIQYTEIGCAEGLTTNQIMNSLSKYPIKYSGVAIDLIDGWSFNIESYNRNNKELIENNLLSLILLDKNNFEKGYDRIAYEFINNPKANHIILIDGDHSYQGVKRDYENALKWIGSSEKKIHLVMFHDSGEDEQGKDINEAQPNGIEVRKFLIDNGLLNSLGTIDFINTNGRSLFVKMIIME